MKYLAIIAMLSGLFLLASTGALPNGFTGFGVSLVSAQEVDYGDEEVEDGAEEVIDEGGDEMTDMDVFGDGAEEVETFEEAEVIEEEVAEVVEPVMEEAVFTEEPEAFAEAAIVEEEAAVDEPATGEADPGQADLDAAAVTDEGAELEAEGGGEIFLPVTEPPDTSQAAPAPTAPSQTSGAPAVSSQVTVVRVRPPDTGDGGLPAPQAEGSWTALALILLGLSGTAFALGRRIAR